MRIEFTVDISSLEALGTSEQNGRIDRSSLADLAWAAESAGIDRLLVAEKGGVQDAASIASYFLHATAALSVEIEHRAGTLPPEIAARQIATLDQLSAGRIKVRVAPAGDDPALSHEDSYARLDEYVMLLKRLWANDKPIDYEGRFHRLKAAFSAAKPFAATSVPIALAGISGTAVGVAARHADVFVLPAASVEETRRTIGRVREAVACHRRADTVRFALPVRPLANSRVASVHHHKHYKRLRPFGPIAGWPARENVRALARSELAQRQAIEGTVLAGSPEKVALALIDYCEVGVSDFIVNGLRTTQDVSTFGSMVAPIVRRALAHRSAHADEEVRTGFTNPAFARWSRYPA